MTSTAVPFLPDNAPFAPAQRAWLNGFFAGLMSKSQTPSQMPSQTATAATAKVGEESFPWHDSSLSMDERMKLADGKPLERRMMAAMAQLDCGACGYVCQTYAEAIVSGTEKSLTKCTPGAKETAAKLKELVQLRVEGVAMAASPTVGSSGHSRDNPFPAPLLLSRRLNSTSSEKEVRHVEIGLKGSDLQYKVGDALGVYPENCLDLVTGILQRLGATGAEETKSIDGRPTSLFDALRRERVITQPTEALIELFVDYATDRNEAKQLQSMLIEEAGAPLEDLHVLDILHLIPSSTPAPSHFVDSLGTLQPRLYSIASSPKVHVDQAHLTVGAVRYTNRRGRRVEGVASTYLSARVRPGEKLRVFIHESKTFAVPENNDAPMIMIGPGTGIAPFRAFLHERRAVGAKGKNWLFFGDQRSACDFLYGDELQAFHRDGFLTKFDTAFSRDQSEKVYVQHRMQQNGKELWDWLQNGAHLYVCGDAKRMAKDVDHTLTTIVQEQGNLDPDSAKQYVKNLSKSKRYQRDVY